MIGKNIFSIVVALLMLSSNVSAVEIRGTVINEAQIPYIWTAQEFAGFYYDLDKGQSFEILKIDSIISRTIMKGNLTYTTEPISIDFSYSKDNNKSIYNDVRTYSVVGWQAEKWVALNGKTNKLVKLLTKLEGTDKVSLTSGGTLTLGNGYVMKINAIDANAAPRQAWVSIMKDGTSIDDAVLQQGSIYNLKRDIGGEKDALVLSAYVSSIFSGQEAQMLQLQYLWFVDESSFTEIKSGTKYGIFEASLDGNKIKLTNTGDISLSTNSKVDLMGNMKFKVADDSTHVRFYPFVEVEGTGIVHNTQTIPTQTVNCTPQIVEKIVEKIVYVTPEPTPEPILIPTPTSTPTPTPTPKPIPGFESGFAIIGLGIVTFIVLRNRKE